MLTFRSPCQHAGKSELSEQNALLSIIFLCACRTCRKPDGNPTKQPSLPAVTSGKPLGAVRECQCVCQCVSYACFSSLLSALLTPVGVPCASELYVPSGVSV